MASGGHPLRFDAAPSGSLARHPGSVVSAILS
jgi:hypothetical protein